MVGEAVIAIGNAYGYEHSVTDLSAVQGPRCDPEQGNGLQGADPDERADQPKYFGRAVVERDGRGRRRQRRHPRGAQNIGFALPIDFVIGRAADLVARRRPGQRLRRQGLRDPRRRREPGQTGVYEGRSSPARLPPPPASSRAMSSNRSTT